jgi:hypothetical protein
MAELTGDKMQALGAASISCSPNWTNHGPWGRLPKLEPRLPRTGRLGVLLV